MVMISFVNANTNQNRNSIRFLISSKILEWIILRIPQAFKAEIEGKITILEGEIHTLTVNLSMGKLKLTY